MDTSHQVQVRDWTGTRVPMHAVSSGLVFLAQLPSSTLDAYLSRDLESFTPRTITSPDALRERLAQVRIDGYAWVHGEFAEGLSSVAAGVADATGVLAAAVHVHGPAYRFPQGRETEFGEQVLAARCAPPSGSAEAPEPPRPRALATRRARDEPGPFGSKCRSPIWLG